MQYEDPVLSELSALYRFREEHAKSYNYDLKAMANDLIREQEELERQGRKFVSFPPRRCRTEFPYTSLDEEPPIASPVNFPPATTDSTAATE